MPFEVGLTYTTQFGKDKPNHQPTLCTSEGFHYCKDLININEFYPFNSRNRFCLIEIFGNQTEDVKKGITTSFRIIREITDLVLGNRGIPIQEIVNKEKIDYPTKKLQRDIKEIELRKEKEEKVKRAELKKELLLEIEKEKEAAKKERRLNMSKWMNLDVVKKLQEAYPLSIIGGSIALFLHGIELPRYMDGDSDLDVIMPYYIPFVNKEGMEFYESEEAFSGSTFDNAYNITVGGKSIKMDVRIDNKETYELIEFEGFQYKVNTLVNIWKAKLDYAVKPGKSKFKHIQDLKDAFFPKEIKPQINDLSW